MTTDLDRALIALRVSRDHGHGAVLNDAEVPALLAEIDRLRQWELVAREWLDKTEWMQSKDTPVRWLGKHRADCLREEVERLTAERDKLRWQIVELRGKQAEIADERDDLRRQLDEAEQDARRYRWLREIYFSGESAFALIGRTRNAHELDASIDAAMRLTRPAEET